MTLCLMFKWGICWERVLYKWNLPIVEVEPLQQSPSTSSIKSLFSILSSNTTLNIKFKPEFQIWISWISSVDHLNNSQSGALPRGEVPGPWCYANPTNTVCGSCGLPPSHSADPREGISTKEIPRFVFLCLWCPPHPNESHCIEVSVFQPPPLISPIPITPLPL